MFYFSSLPLNLYHISSIYEEFGCPFYCPYPSGQPCAQMGGCYITMVLLTESKRFSFPGGISPHTAKTSKRCQITITQTVLLGRNYNYSAKQRNPKSILHIFKFTSTIFPLETNKGGHTEMSSLVLGIYLWGLWLSVILDNHWLSIADLLLHCDIIGWIIIRQWIQ